MARKKRRSAKPKREEGEEGVSRLSHSGVESERWKVMCMLGKEEDTVVSELLEVMPGMPAILSESLSPSSP